MATDYLTAKDVMLTMLMDALTLDAPAVIGYVPEVNFQGTKKGVTPPSEKYHGVAFVHAVKEEQATLCHDVDTLGSRRYNNKGLFEFQIMCPLSDSQNSDRGAKIAYIAQKAFRGKEGSCGIVFYDAMFKAGASTEVFSKHIMTVKYNYDEVSL